MTTQEPVITARGLRKSYRATTVLDGVDLDVGRGEIFAMLGPNGAGKTTTVNILTTLIKADAGTASIAGFDVVRDAAHARGALSLTGQFAAVDPFQTGAENLAMMADLVHLGRREARRRVAELLERFDIGAAAGRRAGTYSGGMRRRLDLAISLLASPPVVFLDEPTTGLDPRSRSQMWSVVRDLAADGTTIFLTTQYLEEADQLADAIAVLTAGRIVAKGTAAQLKSGLKGDRVELSLDGPAAFRSALSVDFGLDAHFDDERWTVSVPAANPVSATRELLALADRNDIAVRAIDILKPTLDDVFLHLTGAGALAPTEEVAA
jgi:ABC-2 type transport system ATP-binding protein